MPDAAGPGPAPVRVIVHAGFHKTGTSSLQDYLVRHRAELAPYLAYYGRHDFLPAATAARRFGRRPFPWRRAAFRHHLRRFLSTIPDAPLIVLSRENFSGAAPGQPDWRGRVLTGYAGTAIPLARILVEELGHRFGPAVRIEFLYTLRARESWLKSLWGHQLREIRLTDDFATFRARFAPDFDLGAEAARIAAAIAPVPVHTARLEDYAEASAGPAEAIFDLAGLPEAVRRALPPARRWNVGQKPGIEAEFLRLNRAGGPRRRLKARKDALGFRTRKPRPRG